MLTEDQAKIYFRNLANQEIKDLQSLLLSYFTDAFSTDHDDLRLADIVLIFDFITGEKNTTKFVSATISILSPKQLTAFLTKLILSGKNSDFLRHLLKAAAPYLSPIQHGEIAIAQLHGDVTNFFAVDDLKKRTATPDSFVYIRTHVWDDLSEFFQLFEKCFSDYRSKAESLAATATQSDLDNFPKELGDRAKACMASFLTKAFNPESLPLLLQYFCHQLVYIVNFQTEAATLAYQHQQYDLQVTEEFNAYYQSRLEEHADSPEETSTSTENGRKKRNLSQSFASLYTALEEASAVFEGKSSATKADYLQSAHLKETFEAYCARIKPDPDTIKSYQHKANITAIGRLLLVHLLGEYLNNKNAAYNNQTLQGAFLKLANVQLIRLFEEFIAQNPDRNLLHKFITAIGSKPPKELPAEKVTEKPKRRISGSIRTTRLKIDLRIAMNDAVQNLLKTLGQINLSELQLYKKKLIRKYSTSPYAANDLTSLTLDHLYQFIEDLTFCQTVLEAHKLINQAQIIKKMLLKLGGMDYQYTKPKIQLGMSTSFSLTRVNTQSDVVRKVQEQHELHGEREKAGGTKTVSANSETYRKAKLTSLKPVFTDDTLVQRYLDKLDDNTKKQELNFAEQQRHQRLQTAPKIPTVRIRSQSWTTGRYTEYSRHDPNRRNSQKFLSTDSSRRKTINFAADPNRMIDPAEEGEFVNVPLGKKC